MRCSARHISFALWRLQVFSRIFLPPKDLHLQSRYLLRRSLSGTPRFHNAGGRKDNSTQDEKHTGTDARETKNVETIRPSKLLPKSPLLTKVKNPLEKEWKKRPKPDDVNRLKRNPWAMALASPPRMCSVTGYRLPKEFLAEWGLVRRPGTESLWFMPVGLLKDELKQAAGGKRTDVPEQPTGGKDSSEMKKPTAEPLQLPVVRTIDRLLLLKEITPQFTGDSSKQKSQLTKIVPHRWKSLKGQITSHELKNLVWREDMPSFVLKNMRKEVVKSLEKASRVCDPGLISNKRAEVWRTVMLAENSLASLIEGLDGMEEMDNMEWGGVLIIGADSPHANGDRSEAGGDQSQYSDESSPTSLPSESQFTSQFPDFVTLPRRGTKVPVFDLSVLLSEADREKLRRCHPRFLQKALFFRPGGMVSVNPMLALWRLKGFTMYDREFLAQDPTIDPTAK